VRCGAALGAMFLGGEAVCCGTEQQQPVRCDRWTGVSVSQQESWQKRVLKVNERAGNAAGNERVGCVGLVVAESDGCQGVSGATGDRRQGSSRHEPRANRTLQAPIFSQARFPVLDPQHHALPMLLSSNVPLLVHMQRMNFAARGLQQHLHVLVNIA
jgi:hypothetical protein